MGLRTTCRKAAATMLILGTVMASATASAAVLINETFTGVTIADGLSIAPGTATPNLNTWIDFPNSNRWSIQSGGICSAPCSGSFAQHLVQATDNTNLLFYGIDGTSIVAGTTLTLSLDFISSNRAGTAYLVGMQVGDVLDPYAPWFQAPEKNGTVLASRSLDSGTWTSASFGTTLSQTYAAYVVAFEMGGTTGSRGIDNVLLQSNKVPEPASLALLALVGLGLFTTRRRRQR